MLYATRSFFSWKILQKGTDDLSNHWSDNFRERNFLRFSTTKNKEKKSDNDSLQYHFNSEDI